MDRRILHSSATAIGVFLAVFAAPAVQAEVTWSRADAVYSVCKRQVMSSMRECKLAARATAPGVERRTANNVCSQHARRQLQVCGIRSVLRKRAAAKAASRFAAADVTTSAAAMVTVDRLDYEPLQIVTIAGVGFLPGETVAIVITESPQTHDPVALSSTADDKGNFLNTDYTVQFSDFGVIFTLTATGQTSGAVATTAFTDSAAPGALAAPTGSLSQTGLFYNNTHWTVEVGDTITGTISGATDLPGSVDCTSQPQPDCCSPQTCTGANQVDVFIQSSVFGNTPLCGTVSGTTITFSWPVPSSGVCDTTHVTYCKEGHGANASLIPGGNANTGAGFAIVDASGAVISSSGTPPSCPSLCGNGVCDSGETCSTCAQDCGACPFCGDGHCTSGEDCSNCSQDCGECGPSCGDGQCNGDETCSTCSPDCGVCPGTLTACKYEDDNANGTDDGEPKLAGWSLTISPVSGAPEGATQVTDSSGCVTWTNLVPGAYSVTEAAPSSGNPWFNTDPAITQSGQPCLIQAGGCPSPTKTDINVISAQTTTVEFGNIQSAQITVCKYEDLNANGANDNEPPLSGWSMSVAGTTSGVGTTDSTGCTSFIVLPIGKYQAAELLQLGPPAWFNTDPGTNGLCTGLGQPFPCCTDKATGSCGPCLASDCPVPAKSGLSVSAGGQTTVYFGNLQGAEKHGQKFYDVNTDGTNNDNQTVAGIKITLTGTDLLAHTVGPLVTYTDALGNYAFTNLLPSCGAPPCPETGYTVTETKPNSKWINTTPTSITFGLDPGEVETNNNFGNVCVGAGGGLTIGFWSNKNGQAAMTTAGMSGALSLLDGLNLRNANGSNFDPTTYTQYRNWLLSASATNMAYMLSAQLSAMEMNVRSGFVSSRALVFAGTAPAGCSVTGLNGNGFVSISALMDDANSSLGANGYTVATGAVRSCQEFMKIALDKANNNLNFVQATSCPFASPY